MAEVLFCQRQALFREALLAHVTVFCYLLGEKVVGDANESGAENETYGDGDECELVQLVLADLDRRGQQRPERRRRHHSRRKSQTTIFNILNYTKQHTTHLK